MLNKKINIKNIKKIVYLDNAATTPMDLKVKKEVEKYFSKNYGNPSSLHRLGRKAKRVVDNARFKIANILNAQQKEIIFTAGGTESDNMAIFGIARAYKKFGNHIIVSKIEHHAVLNPCEALKKEGFEITYINVDKEGIIDLEEFKKSLKSETILVSVMYANNEIGTIQPIAKIAKIISDFRKKKLEFEINDSEFKEKIFPPFFHTDACQAAGYLDLNVKNLGVDLMTLNGSKIYGPKQIGILYKKTGIDLEPIIYGGGQEFNLRSGTENVASIAGLAKALELAEKNKKSEVKRLTILRNYLIDNLIKKIPKIVLNGDLKNRLPNNINISILGIEGESILLMLDDYGICASTGSACTSKSLKPSHVIVALTKSDELAHSSIRFTLGKFTKKSDVDYLLKVLPNIVKNLRSISSIKNNQY